MNIKKFGILCLSASMVGATGVALNNLNASEVKAESESNLILTHQQEKFLNIFAKKMHQDKNDYYAYLNDWLNDPTENRGINYFNDFDDEKTEFYTYEIEAAKNSLYFDTLLTIYMFDKEPNIDTYRMIIDHYVPLKEALNAVSDYCSYEVIAEKTEVASYFCKVANETYAVIKTTFMDFCGLDEVPENEVVAFNEFKTFLSNQSDYLRLNADVTVNPYTTYLNIAKITNLFTGLDLTILEDAADSFIQNYTNVNDSFELLDYTQTDIDTWFGDETTYHEEIMTHFNRSLYTLFYYFKTIQYFEMVCPDNFNGFALINSNIGPSMYKMLDLIEAIRGDTETHIPDYPNTLILSLDLFNDIKALLDLFNDEVGQIIKNDINKYSALEDVSYIEWKDVQVLKTNNAVAAFKTAFDAYKEDGKYDEAFKACDDAEKVCAELLADLTVEREALGFMSPDMDYILRTVNDLELKAYTFRKDVSYDKLEASVDEISDEYVDLANTDIDSIETYDAVDEGLKNVWYDLYLVSIEATTLSEKYSDKKFKDILVDIQIFYAQTLDVILEKHTDVMDLIEDEVNAVIDSVDGKANLIYTLSSEMYPDVKELLKLAVALTGVLDRLVTTLGEYEDHFGVESTINALKLKEELEYAKVSTLIENLKGLQKELAIESIVLRGTDLTDKVNNAVENKASESECDALIEELNGLITEINDNYELLDQDERLEQTRVKMNQSIEEINNLKAQIKAEHTRNVVLIVVGSVVGAALFFIGGFFLAKLLSKKTNKEKENA